MKLLKIQVQGVPLFKNDTFELDLYAKDRVPLPEDETLAPNDVFRLAKNGTIYSQNIIRGHIQHLAQPRKRIQTRKLFRRTVLCDHLGRHPDPPRQFYRRHTAPFNFFPQTGLDIFYHTKII